MLNTCWWRRLGGRHFWWFEVRYWGTSKFFEKFLNVINAMRFRQTSCIFLIAKEKFKNIQKAFMVFDFIFLQFKSRYQRDALIFTSPSFFRRCWSLPTPLPRGKLKKETWRRKSEHFVVDVNKTVFSIMDQ